MAFQISPGIQIQERDLTNIVPAVATTAGGFVGNFIWGPANQRVLIDSEQNLASVFGTPADNTTYSDSDGIANGATDFFTAAAFLEYGNNLTVVRTLNGATSATNATSNGVTTAVVQNEDVYETGFGDSGFSTDYGVFIAKYPGALGNSVTVSMCDGLGGTLASGTTSATKVFRVLGNDLVSGTFSEIAAPNPSAAVTGTTVGIGQTAGGPVAASSDFKLLSANDEDGSYSFYLQSVGTDFENQLTVGSTASDLYVYFGSTGLKVSRNASTNAFNVFESATTDINEGTAFEVWEHQSSFEAIPETSSYASNLNGVNDELHVVIVDSDGLWSGTPGTILERYPYLSKARDGKAADGTSNYWVDVLREQSEYVYVSDTTVSTDLTGGGEEFSVNANNKTFGQFGVRDFNLSGGSDGNRPRAADLVTAQNSYFNDPETVDVQLMIGNGATSESDAKTIADNLISLCAARLDCLAFLSPAYSDVSGSTPMEDLIEFRNTLSSTSYAVLDTGWKKRFDAYNDVDRWIPLSGDVAGLCVRTDRLADPWFSPAGLNRGQIRNSIKLAFNPTKVQRDRIYSSNINPVVTFPGEGTVLFGDKTLLTRPSAFDRINVRRLFITLEKAIAVSSRYILFENNDSFTRSQFRNLVEPFLRDVQGRRGITDYRVVVDETVNTPQVINNNEFRANIFIKPTYSINYISLSFVATPQGLSFDELI